MARITLKVTKPADPTAAPREPTSRAWRASHGKPPKRQAPSPAAEPAAPAPPVVSVRPPAHARRDQSASATGRRDPSAPASGRRDHSAPSSSRRRNTASAAEPSARTPQTRPLAPIAKADAARAILPPADTARPRFEAHAKSGNRSRRAPDPSALPRAAPKPIVASTAPKHENPDDPRLSKRMSELGLCSRREADEWIVNGWVRVDGKVVDVLGTRVSGSARIEIDAAATAHQLEQVTIVLNKPMGYVSGQAEDGHEPAMVLIKPDSRWADDPSPTKFKMAHLRGLAPAGRLDIDSTGLIVFTQDGRIAKQLIGRDSEVEKEYLVRVEGTLTDQGMKLLHHGLELDDVKLKPAKVSWQNEDQLRFVLREGRKRQIRRMCELVGLTVTGLKRVRTGSVPLGQLPVGQWRYLRWDEKF
jgi:23S rRNA pseudouridine2604 synthase